MKTLKAHFDGKVIVPDEPVDLPQDCELEVQVRAAGENGAGAKPLKKLLELAQAFPVSGLPSDAAAEHDHYLYGTPKRDR